MPDDGKKNCEQETAKNQKESLTRTKLIIDL